MASQRSSQWAWGHSPDPLLGGASRKIRRPWRFVAGYLKAEIDPLERTFLDLRNLFEEMTSEVGEKEADTLGPS